MPKTTNVFTVEFTDTDRMYVNAAIVSIVAKSPTAALAAALEAFKNAAREIGKGTAFNQYSVKLHDMRLYTVRAWRE